MLQLAEPDAPEREWLTSRCILQQQPGERRRTSLRSCSHNDNTARRVAKFYLASLLMENMGEMAGNP